MLAEQSRSSFVSHWLVVCSFLQTFPGLDLDLIKIEHRKEKIIVLIVLTDSF